MACPSWPAGAVCRSDRRQRRCGSVLSLRPPQMVRLGHRYEYYERTLRGQFIPEAEIARHMDWPVDQKLPGYTQLMRSRNIDGSRAYHLTTFLKRASLPCWPSSSPAGWPTARAGNNSYWKVARPARRPSCWCADRTEETGLAKRTRSGGPRESRWLNRIFRSDHSPKLPRRPHNNPPLCHVAACSPVAPVRWLQPVWQASRARPWHRRPLHPRAAKPLPGYAGFKNADAVIAQLHHHRDQAQRVCLQRGHAHQPALCAQQPRPRLPSPSWPIAMHGRCRLMAEEARQADRLASSRSWAWKR